MQNTFSENQKWPLAFMPEPAKTTDTKHIKVKGYIKIPLLASSTSQ